VPLPAHFTRKKGTEILTADEPLSLLNTLPKDLHKKHADQPTEKGVKPASRANKIELAATEKYELNGAH